MPRPARVDRVWCRWRTGSFEIGGQSGFDSRHPSNQYRITTSHGMKPYYQDDLITLFKGDCRDILPAFGARHFALCVADPPYGIKETDRRVRGTNAGFSGFYSHSRQKPSWTPANEYDDIDYDAERWDTSHLQRIRYASEHQVIWGGNYYADLLPASPSWLIWDKETTGHFSDVELAWTSHETAARIFRYRWNGMLQQPGQPREKRLYPGQKPVALMRWVLTLFKPSGIVLDPCCGSGPVPRACKDLGIPCVAMDISERALELTVNRLQQETLPLEMVTQSAPDPLDFTEELPF